MIEVLAATVVGKYLVPVLTSGFDKFFSTAGEQVGDAVADQTKAVYTGLWSRIRAAFAGPEDAGVLSHFEQQPEAARSLVQTLLEQKLARDPELVREFEALLAQDADRQQPAAQVINQLSGGIVGQVNAEGAHVHGNGKIVAVMIGGPDRPRPRAIGG